MLMTAMTAIIMILIYLNDSIIFLLTIFNLAMLIINKKYIFDFLNAIIYSLLSIYTLNTAISIDSYIILIFILFIKSIILTMSFNLTLNIVRDRKDDR